VSSALSTHSTDALWGRCVWGSQLMFHLYSTIVVLVPFLRESGDNGGQDIPFSLAFCARLREQTMVKGHIVFEQGEPVPSTMFIIADGLVQLFKRAEGEVASALSSGHHFGAFPLDQRASWGLGEVGLQCATERWSQFTYAGSAPNEMVEPGHRTTSPNTHTFTDEALH
jgi:hypothetical protein